MADGNLVPARFADIVLGALRSASVQFEIGDYPGTDRTTRINARQHSRMTPGGRFYDHAPAHQVLVRHGEPPAAVSTLIAEILNPFCAKRIRSAVVFRRADDAHGLATTLRAAGHGVGLLTDRAFDTPDAPTLVGTLHGLAGGPDGFAGRAVVVLADAMMAFDIDCHTAIRRADTRPALLLAFLSEDRARSGFDDFRLLSAFGTHQYWGSAGVPWPRPVVTTAVRGCQNSAVAGRVLPRIATACRNGDSAFLRQHCPALAAHVERTGPVRAVLLDAAGRRVATAESQTPTARPDAEAAQKLYTDADVVIRLSGTLLGLQLFADRLRRPRPDGRPLIIVDTHPRANADRRRWATYADAGFGTLGEHPTVGWYKYARAVAAGHGPLLSALNRAMPDGRPRPIRVHAPTPTAGRRRPASGQSDDQTADANRITVLTESRAPRRPYDPVPVSRHALFRPRRSETYSGPRRRPQTRAVEGTVEGLPWLEDVMSRQNLVCVFSEMQRYAGDAPGPDGLRLSALSVRDAGTILEPVGHAVLAGTYRPGPTRPHVIDKPSGGTRTLQIANLDDRVVAGALYRALVPAVDPRFLDNSFGFRPGRSHLQLLARLARAIESGMYVVTADDMATAFDRVGLDRLDRTFACHVVDGHYQRLLRRIMRGGRNTNRREGIAQGNALSPLMLNLYLHDGHDFPLYSGNNNPPFAARYADNVVIATATAREGNEWHDRTVERLDAIGMSLKGAPGIPIDLRQDSLRVLTGDYEASETANTVPLLGFHVTLASNGVQFRLDDAALSGIRSALEAAHETPDPTLSARCVVSGFLESIGPALDSHGEQLLRHVRQALRDTGHRVDPRRHLERIAAGVLLRWHDTLQAAPGPSAPSMGGEVRTANG